MADRFTNLGVPAEASGDASAHPWRKEGGLERSPGRQSRPLDAPLRGLATCSGKWSAPHVLPH
jgi:hypothetical protein